MLSCTEFVREFTEVIPVQRHRRISYRLIQNGECSCFGVCVSSVDTNGRRTEESQFFSESKEDVEKLLTVLYEQAANEIIWADLAHEIMSAIHMRGEGQL